jgi:tetratricopeptide (TPR) repeat protein
MTLNRGREVTRALREEASRDEAEFLASEARLDHLQLAYREAAQKYAKAAALVAQLDGDDEWYYVHQQARELSRYGDEFGDNQALEASISVSRHALSLVKRERNPLDWATTQHNLANALSMLGDRETNAARLEEAVLAYYEVMKEWTRERSPLDWATAQNNLGNTLVALGERASGTARLEEAVTAFRETLKERTRELVPLEWAMTQNNLGNALWMLGQREVSTNRLKEAVIAYREALKEQTRERVPFQWASTLTNLGVALGTIGQRNGDIAALEEAVTCYREALKECSRERGPLQWASTQNNLGSTLSMLGDLEGNIARLEEAVIAYREALKEQTRERVPLDWASTMNNLGNTLLALGRRESDVNRVEEAITAYHDALSIYEPAGVASADDVQQNLGFAEQLLRERRDFGERDLTMQWDVFISHASEDKENFARPLATRLRENGLRVWFDEFTLTIGDSLRRSIDHGLAKSRYGIVVISPDFLKKEWPQKELDGLVSREIEGVKVILPVWHNIGATEIRAWSPILADRLAGSSSAGLDHVIQQLLEAMQSGPAGAEQIMDAPTTTLQRPHSSAEHQQYAAELHTRRVAQIIDHKGSATIMDGGALVMHVVPVSAIGDTATDAFESMSGRPEKFSPIGSGGGRDYRISYDGLVVGSNNEGLSKPQRAYVSVFRSGAIEAVQSSLANSRDNLIVLPELQASIIKFAYIYARSLKEFSVLPPFAVSVSLLHVRGTILLPDFIPRGALIGDLPSNELDRNSYNFGQVIFKTMPQNYNEAAKALRPILTHLANAAGLQSSPYFDAAGNYALVDKL